VKIVSPASDFAGGHQGGRVVRARRDGGLRTALFVTRVYCRLLRPGLCKLVLVVPAVPGARGRNLVFGFLVGQEMPQMSLSEWDHAR
jgi:hypothetical protein